MINKRRQSGLSLIEQVMVVASVAAIMVFALPAAKSLFNNMQTPAGTKNMISSALASARAMAAKSQRYVGVRFQHAYYKDEPLESPLKMPQYMILIIYDISSTGFANGFRAIDGAEPIKLPDNIGVMDLYIDESNYEKIDNDNDLDDNYKLNDATTFSIIFSPSGKLFVRDFHVINRDGETNNINDSEDDIFNTDYNVNEGYAMFMQDYNPASSADTPNRLRLEKEPSRRAFIIYDRNIFRSLPEGDRYDDYIEDLIDNGTVYLNAYTGTMIEK